MFSHNLSYFSILISSIKLKFRGAFYIFTVNSWLDFKIFQGVWLGLNYYSIFCSLFFSHCFFYSARVTIKYPVRTESCTTRVFVFCLVLFINAIKLISSNMDIFQTPIKPEILHRYDWNFQYCRVYGYLNLSWSAWSRW